MSEQTALIDGCYTSNAGINLVAKVLAQRGSIHYTRVAVGKGRLPAGVSPRDVTEPPDFVMNTEIASVTTPVNGECQVTIQIRSGDVDFGFFATAFILYAEDPDLGEVPFTYLRLEDQPEWIRPKTAAISKVSTINFIAAVGDVEQVSAALDPEAYVTAAAWRETNEQINEDIPRYQVVDEQERDPGLPDYDPAGV